MLRKEKSFIVEQHNKVDVEVIMHSSCQWVSTCWYHLVV